MILTLHNVGCLKTEDVRLKDVTVIHGNTRTGKSTISKVLYCIYDSLCNLRGRISKDKTASILRAVDRVLIGTGYSTDRMFLEEKLQNTFLLVEKPEQEIQDCIRDFLDTLDPMQGAVHIDYDKAEEAVKEVCSISDAEIVRCMFRRSIAEEFGHSLAMTDKGDQPVEIILRSPNPLGSGQDQMFIYNSEHPDQDQFFGMYSKAVLIDNPFVLDSLEGYLQGMYERGHNFKLAEMLTVQEESTVIEDIISRASLEKVIQKLRKVVKGNLVREQGEFVYKEHPRKPSLSLRSLSSGEKILLILKTLIQNKTLPEHGLLILDSVDAFLTANWQSILAETVVRLQKTYDVKVLLTTRNKRFAEKVKQATEKAE